MQDTPDDVVETRPHFHERRGGAVRNAIASHCVANLVREVQNAHLITDHHEKTAENAMSNVVRACGWVARCSHKGFSTKHRLESIVSSLL